MLFEGFSAQGAEVKPQPVDPGPVVAPRLQVGQVEKRLLGSRDERLLFAAEFEQAISVAHRGLQVAEGVAPERRRPHLCPARSATRHFRHELRNRTREGEGRQAADIGSPRQAVCDQKRMGNRLPVRRREGVKPATELNDSPSRTPAGELAEQTRVEPRPRHQETGLEDGFVTDDLQQFRECHGRNLAIMLIYCHVRSGYGAFLRRAAFARIASRKNAASPWPRFSKYSVNRGSATYMSAKPACIAWLHG